jgi:hypothetical protein
LIQDGGSQSMPIEKEGSTQASNQLYNPIPEKTSSPNSLNEEVSNWNASDESIDT